MSPVRKVHGKQMSAASGSNTPQKLSMMTVRIMGSSPPGIRLSTTRRGGLLPWRDIVYILQFKLNFFAAAELPLQGTLASGTLNFQLNCVPWMELPQLFLKI